MESVFVLWKEIVHLQTFTTSHCSIEGLFLSQSVMCHLCHIICAHWIPRLGGNAPDVAFSVLNLAVLSESDAWAAPLSEPDSSMTRPFPAGSKFYSFL